MRNVIFLPLRSSLLAAMGFAVTAACSTNVTVEQSGSSGAGASSSANTSTGVGAAPSTLCVGAKTILANDGSDSGFAQCPDGTIHRVSALSCDTTIDMPACDATAESMSCTSDAECVDGMNGKCALFSTIGFDGLEHLTCGCTYSCGSDADCGSDQVCVCGGVIGGGHSFCADASCKTNADCPSGECGLSQYDDGCGMYYSLACRSASDVCRLDQDCGDLGQCAVTYDSMDQWTCASQSCAIGRPMLVEGRARTAPLASGDAWAQAACRPDLSGLSAAQCETLATHWASVAQLEHASVASFARFVMQLMAVGAPSELLREAQGAMADEVEHAELAFTLASRYAGRELGPGPLDLEGTQVASDLCSVLIGLAEEACVGETLGVAEALAAAQQVKDPALGEVLRRIADDELRHAGLAWRTLRWGLGRADGETRRRVRAAILRAMDQLACDPDSDREALPEHGLLSAREIGSVRRQALRDVVAPCAEAAFADLA